MENAKNEGLIVHPIQLSLKVSINKFYDLHRGNVNWNKLNILLIQVNFFVVAR